MGKFVTLTVSEPGTIGPGMRPPLVFAPITLPVIEVGENLVQFPAPNLVADTVARIVHLAGSLYKIASGTVVVVVRNNAGTIATLSWTAAGIADIVPGGQDSLLPNDTLHIDITDAGHNAKGLAITLWMSVPNTCE